MLVKSRSGRGVVAEWSRSVYPGAQALRLLLGRDTVEAL